MMDDRIKVFERSGKEIVYVDFSNLNDAKHAVLLQRSMKTLQLIPGYLRVIFNYHNVEFSESSLSIHFQIAQKIASRFQKLALIGIGPSQETYVNLLSRHTKICYQEFSELEEALQYMCSDLT